MESFLPGRFSFTLSAPTACQRFSRSSAKTGMHCQSFSNLHGQEMTQNRISLRIQSLFIRIRCSLIQEALMNGFDLREFSGLILEEVFKHLTGNPLRSVAVEHEEPELH